MKYLFIDKNTWGYYDDELKLLGDYKDDGISWYMADEEQLPEIVDRLFAEYKLDDQTTNDNDIKEDEEESQNN